MRERTIVGSNDVVYAEKKWLGGLGIRSRHDNQALRLLWRWSKWADKSKTWTGVPIQVTTIEELFRTCTTITIGNGKTTWNWKDKCLNGYSQKDNGP